MSSVLKATVENKTMTEVKHPTLIVTEFFINKQNFRKTLTIYQWYHRWRYWARAEE